MDPSFRWDDTSKVELVRTVIPAEAGIHGASKNPGNKTDLAEKDFA
jgi:hypothetical protein